MSGQRQRDGEFFNPSEWVENFDYGIRIAHSPRDLPFRISGVDCKVDLIAFIPHG